MAGIERLKSGKEALDEAKKDLPGIKPTPPTCERVDAPCVPRRDPARDEAEPYTGVMAHPGRLADRPPWGRHVGFDDLCADMAKYGPPTFPKVLPTEAPPVEEGLLELGLGNFQRAAEPVHVEDVETAPKNNLAEKKPLPNLIPMDILMKYLEPAYQEGLLKYSRESWRGGFKTSLCIDSARRHIYAFYYGGQDMDPDSLVDNKHHLAAAIFWLTCNLQSMDARPELDDRWSKND